VVRAEDERQYTEYVTARLPTLRRTAFLLCGDEHRADDIVQAAITKLYVHWRRVSTVDNLDAYVRSMVVRTFLSEQRLGWFRRTSLVGAPEETPDRPAPATNEVETRMVLHRALARIAPKARAVLVLRFLLDASVADTAAALGCSAGTVKSQTALGLANLRRQLGDQLPATVGKE